MGDERCIWWEFISYIIVDGAAYRLSCSIYRSFWQCEIGHIHTNCLQRWSNIMHCLTRRCICWIKMSSGSSMILHLFNLRVPKSVAAFIDRGVIAFAAINLWWNGRNWASFLSETSVDVQLSMSQVAVLVNALGIFETCSACSSHLTSSCLLFCLFTSDSPNSRSSSAMITLLSPRWSSRNCKSSSIRIRDAGSQHGQQQTISAAEHWTIVPTVSVSQFALPYFFQHWCVFGKDI